MRLSAEHIAIVVSAFRRIGIYLLIFLLVRGLFLIWNGPVAEYDTMSYLRGGLDWDVFHPPFTNIVLSLCKAISATMWLPAILQVLVNAIAAALLVDACIPQHRIVNMLAIVLAALEPVSGFHTLTLLSEGWYMPITMLLLVVLIRQAQGRIAGNWILFILAFIAPWIRLQATVELGLLLGIFVLSSQTRKMAIIGLLGLVLSAASLHLTYRIRFGVSPFDASVRSDHASGMIPDPLPENGWDFIYGYQQMYNTCISQDTHPEENGRHRACLDLLKALPRISPWKAATARWKLNLNLAFHNPFLSEHQQGMLDMRVPDQFMGSAYGTDSWPYRYRAVLPVPQLLPWLTAGTWLILFGLLVQTIIRNFRDPMVLVYLWLVTIPLMVMVMFFYKERFLSAWHASAVIAGVAGILPLFQRKPHERPA